MSIESKLKSFILKVESTLGVKAKIAIGLLVFLAVYTSASRLFEHNDVTASSVAITNMSQNSGGSGVILRSNDKYSEILTNSHVCGVVENGGLVSNKKLTFMVVGYKRSETHDLCLVKVLGNFRANTKVAGRTPTPYYEKAVVSGHPALMPNVVTSGHFSGRANIQILTDIKKCTYEEANHPETGLFCAILGGLPVIKNFDSVLVTATIMPGSSGSGVYNHNDELSGLVFAGSGSLGYAWTVPYENLRNFLDSEINDLEEEKPTDEVTIGRSRKEESDIRRKAREACATSTEEKIKPFCRLIKQDLIWRKE